MLEKQLELASTPSSPDYYLMFAAEVSALLGKKDQVFTFLEEAYEKRQGIVFMKIEPQLDTFAPMLATSIC